MLYHNSKLGYASLHKIQDANNAIENHVICYADTLTAINCPTSEGVWYIIIPFMVNQHTGFQIAVTINTQYSIYIRKINNSSYNGWKEIAISW